MNCDADAGGDAGVEWALGVHATFVRAHHHAAGARRRPPVDVPAEVLAPAVLDVALRPGRHTGGGIE